MKHRMVLVWAVAVFSLTVLGNRSLDEGMWLLDSVNRLPLADFQNNGLALTAEQIFSVHGPSLKDAIVLLGGGTGSFISSEGLIITNHHVAFAGLSSLSSVQDDYLKNGFWAQQRGQELSTTYTAQVMVGMKDVTQDILAVVKEGMTPEARSKAISAKSQELEAAGKAGSGYACRVSEMYSGMKYYLFTYEQIQDVRMVYAPPGAIGNYGGETDNWMWPRHTGDFSLMRAYVGKDGKPAKYAAENVPYHPRAFLPISSKGYTDGSFAMILGFPGRTFRYREASAIALAREESLPLTAALYKARMEVMENAWAHDRALQIRLASRWRGLANTYKNTLGMLEGMRTSDLVSRRRAQEKELSSWMTAGAERAARYGTVIADLDQTNAELRTVTAKNMLLTNLNSGVDLFRLANRLRAFAFSRDSLGAETPVPEKMRSSVNEFIATVFRTYDPSVDKATLRVLILKSLSMPATQQVAAFQNIASSLTGSEREKAVHTFVEELYAATTLGSPDGARKMTEQDPATIRSDAFVKFALAIHADGAPLTARIGKLNATLNTLRGKYIEAWTTWKGTGPVYPDANRTLRLTIGTVKPYLPRDAVRYSSATTLTGVIEKETGEGDFVVPERLKELWKKKDFGPYADPALHDVPVAFLSNLDITGGNSGSPVINGKGELIGCAFDGNWEALVGDYVFQEAVNRTISVDARYVLFILDRFSGAQNLLREMTIR